MSTFPVPLQGFVRRMPDRPGGIPVRRRHILFRGGGKCPGVIFGFDRRDGVEVLVRRRVTIGRLHPGRVGRHRIGTPGRFGAAALQRQLPLPQFGFRLLCLLFRLPLDPMHVPHRGRSQVAARASVEFLEGVEVLAGNAAALGQQGGEVVRPGAKGRCLFLQHGMAGERLAVSRPKRHGIAFNAGPFAEIVICRENLSSAIDESAHRLGVTPAEGSAPDIPRDASQRVVVRSCVDITRLALGFARGAASVLPDILPAVFPYAVGHIVERRLLGLRARPSFGQIRPDLGVRHRNFPVVVGPPVGDIEGERRPVDVDVEPLAMARCGGINRLARGPRVGQQERPVHGQPLGRGNSKGIAVIETDIAVPVANFVVMERDGPPILGARRYQDTRLRSGLAPFNLEVLYRDHGAVEQLLLPVRGADAQTVATYDLEWRSRPVRLPCPC